MQVVPVHRYVKARRNGKKFTLTELQALVGGYIEMVRIPGDAGRRVFLVDKEGRLKRLPRASQTSARFASAPIRDAMQGK